MRNRKHILCLAMVCLLPSGLSAGAQGSSLPLKAFEGRWMMDKTHTRKGLAEGYPYYFIDIKVVGKSVVITRDYLTSNRKIRYPLLLQTVASEETNVLPVVPERYHEGRPNIDYQEHSRTTFKNGKIIRKSRFKYDIKSKGRNLTYSGSGEESFELKNDGGSLVLRVEMGRAYGPGYETLAHGSQSYHFFRLVEPARK